MYLGLKEFIEERDLLLISSVTNVTTYVLWYIVCLLVRFCLLFVVVFFFVGFLLFFFFFFFRSFTSSGLRSWSIDWVHQISKKKILSRVEGKIIGKKRNHRFLAKIQHVQVCFVCFVLFVCLFCFGEVFVRFFCLFLILFYFFSWHQILQMNKQRLRCQCSQDETSMK